MKKILSGNIVENTRRQPFTKVSLDHIQEAFQEVFADMLKALIEDTALPVLIHGCVDSDAGATNWNISSGSVMYQGEVYRVEASGLLSDLSLVPVLSIVTTYAAGDPVRFTDNNLFNVHEIRKMQWTLAASGSGLADFAAVKRFRKDESLQFIIDGGGTEIPVGLQGHLIARWDCEIQSCMLLSQDAGSIVINLWKDTYTSFPPVVGDSIVASAKPTLTSAQKSVDTSLTGWTKTILKGDIIGYNVESNSGIKRVTIDLPVFKK